MVLNIYNSIGERYSWDQSESNFISTAAQKKHCVSQPKPIWIKLCNMQALNKQCVGLDTNIVYIVIII